MKICDTHNDFLVEIRPTCKKLDYIKKDIINNKKIKYVCAQVWTSKLKNPEKYIKSLYKKFFNKTIVRINSKALFCLEGLDFVNRSNVNSSLKFIKSLKPFSCGIVWNNDNYLGGGAFGNKGLTRAGKAVVHTLESNGILIDTAHMNRRTFYDFCKISNKPIFNSHSNINELKKHPRNLTSRQIKTVIDSGGFIGLSFVRKFISDKIVDVHDIALQIKYFVGKYGEDNIGIGSDFFGTTPLPQGLTTYKEFKNLKKDLKILGLSNNQIKKILYKNFFNFKKRVEQ